MISPSYRIIGVHSFFFVEGRKFREMNNTGHHSLQSLAHKSTVVLPDFNLHHCLVGDGGIKDSITTIFRTQRGRFDSWRNRSVHHVANHFQSMIILRHYSKFSPIFDVKRAMGATYRQGTNYLEKIVLRPFQSGRSWAHR